MSLFSLLQILIVLILIYFIVSLVVSELQEQLSAFIQWRAKNLKKAIQIFAGKEFCTKKLYNFGLEGAETLFSSFNQYTNSRFLGKSFGPSYIKPEVFAEVIIGLINDALSSPDKLSANQKLFPQDNEENIITTLDLILSNQGNEEAEQEGQGRKVSKRGEQKNQEYELIVKRLKEIAYITRLKHDDPDIQDLTKEIANTFENIMERTSGVYKRNAKGVSLLVGLLTALVFNIDTLHIVDELYKNPELGQGVEQLATKVVSTHKNCLEAANSDEAKIEACQEDLEASTDNLKSSFAENQSLPIGWNDPGWANYLTQIEKEGGRGQKALGWFISAIAISMGAPFWFEMLGKVMNVRNTLRPLSAKAIKK